MGTLFWKGVWGAHNYYYFGVAFGRPLQHRGWGLAFGCLHRGFRGSKSGPKTTSLGVPWGVRRSLGVPRRILRGAPRVSPGVPPGVPTGPPPARGPPWRTWGRGIRWSGGLFGGTLLGGFYLGGLLVHRGWESRWGFICFNRHDSCFFPYREAGIT